MSAPARDTLDVLVIGAGPAGVVAALRAARLGARTALLSRDALGGMAANDGPVPVRTLAHAARLLREARQLPRYGITAGEPALDYSLLLARVRDVTADVQAQSLLRQDLAQAGVQIYEHAGTASFVDPHTIASENVPPLRASRIIVCTGGISRALKVPGFALTCTHSDAWRLIEAPPSLLVVGAGATGIQVASIFNAFGTRVTVFEAGPRILLSEDEDVSLAVGQALQASGVRVIAGGGGIEAFERCPTGVALIYSDGQGPVRLEAALVLAPVGWVADASGLHLENAGVQTDKRGYIQVDDELRTSAPHIFAAGDVTGRLMVVHEAVREGFLAAGNAVLGRTRSLLAEVSPLGSFTDPEYASVGLTEAQARQSHDVITATHRFDETTRSIIDGRTTGFCKLVADRERRTILGAHIVGERAVELAQAAAIAIAAGMTIEQLALVPFSFPTYANALGRAAISAAGTLDGPLASAVEQLRYEARAI
jgi:dihydrolipoamide dehydrogenase